MFNTLEALQAIIGFTRNGQIQWRLVGEGRYEAVLERSGTLTLETEPSLRLLVSNDGKTSEAPDNNVFGYPLRLLLTIIKNGLG